MNVNPMILMFTEHDSTVSSIRPYQVLSGLWRRSIYISSRSNSMKGPFHHLCI